MEKNKEAVAGAGVACSLFTPWLVKQETKTAHNAKHTTLSVKHGRGSVMAWACMAASGTLTGHVSQQILNQQSIFSHTEDKTECIKTYKQLLKLAETGYNDL